MITDILLAPDVVVEACLTKDKISTVIEAISKAGKDKVKTWLYVGSVDRIHGELKNRLMTVYGLSDEKASEKASELFSSFAKHHQWLSALSEDGDVLDSPYPLYSQLYRALERLGEGARILSRENHLYPSKAISPEEYLKFLPENALPVPFVNLSAQQDLIRSELEKRIFYVLRHGRYVGGPEIAELETRLKEEVNVRHVITCSSGTDALLMALLALGIGPGDAVLTVPFTFIATAEVIRLVGATPIFVDIDPLTFVIDPEALLKTLEAMQGKPNGVAIPPRARNLKPKAVITVDLFGCPAPYEEISQIARRFGIFVIEDAAQAFGATYRGRPAGSLGDIGCTSFFPAKTLGAYGDGGAIFTDSDAISERLRLIRNHGSDSVPYHHKILGLNGRLDSIQAAVLLAKLRIFHEEKKKRKNIAELYTKALSKLKAVTPPKIPEGIESAWSQYSILTPSKSFRDELRKRLAETGIPTAIYYPYPLHLQPVFRDLGYKQGDFPVAEECAERILSLPMHPYVEEEIIEKTYSVAETLQRDFMVNRAFENPLLANVLR